MSEQMQNAIPAPAKSCCPTCGRAVEAAPEIPQFVVATGEISFRGKSVRVRPSLIDLFSLLMDAFPNAVPHRRLFDELYADRCESEMPELNTISVHVAHLRRAVRGAGLAFQIVARQGYGDRGGYAVVVDSQ